MANNKKYKFFNPGDLVFAKLQGYASWPARVEECLNKQSNPKYARYKVFFFWTYDTAVCKATAIYDYEATKVKFSKCNAYGFAEAMWEIENTPNVTYKSNRTADTKITQDGATSTGVKKRKIADSAEKHSSILNQSKDVQQEQLSKPCFVRLERLKLDAMTMNIPKFTTDLFDSSSCASTSASANIELLEKSSEVSNRITATSKANFVCNFCSKSFSVFKLLLQHIQNTHHIQPFICWRCEEIFLNEASMKYHSQRCNEPCTWGNIKYSCTLCNMKPFANDKQLTFHVLLKHPKVTDIYIEERDRHQLEILKDIGRSFANLPCNVIHCSTCKLDFGTSAFFDIHIEQFPYTVICACPFCDTNVQKFVEQPMLYFKHIYNHCKTNFNAKKCSGCEALLPNRVNESYHMLHKHSSIASGTSLRLNRNELECEEYLPTITNSERSAESTEELGVVAKHDVRDRFVIHCSICSQDIVDDDYFDNHYAKCFENKNFVCPLCGEEMRKDEQHITDYLTHVENHFSHGMRTVQCTKCNLLFYNIFNQVIHMGNIHYSQSSCTTLQTSQTITKQLEEYGKTENTEHIAEQETNKLRSKYKIQFEKALQDLIQCSELQLQKNDSNKIYTIFCMSCTKDIPYRYYFVNHIKKCCVKQFYLCAFCGKKFSTKDKYPFQYICHIQEHIVKPFCTYDCECGFVFIDNYNGIVHRSTNNHLHHE